MNIPCHIVSFRPALLLVALLAPTSMGQEPVEGIALPEGIEATGDTTEVRALTAWIKQHRETYPKRARQLAQRALTLARNVDDQEGIGSSLLALGNLSPDPHRQKTYYRAAEETFERIGNSRGLILSWLNLGAAYSKRGELEQALSMYFSALRGFERLGDTDGQARVLNNIGLVHTEQNNLEEALTYYERALSLIKTSDDLFLYSAVLMNLGIALTEREAYDKAAIHLHRALDIAKQQEYRRYIAFISNNIGFLYNRQEHYERAIPHLLTAERLGNQLDLGEASLLIPLYAEFGKAYMGLEKYDKALHYANMSLGLARETGIILRQMEAHQALSQIYEALGDDGQALTHYRNYATLRDSVFTTEKAEIVTEMQARYETEEQKRANERLEQENRIQALQLILLLGGVGALLLILGVLFYRYRLNQRANRLLEDLDRAKSRFFADISHEFRTPLTVILGGLQDNITRRLNRDEKRFIKEQHAMLRNTRQLQRLIDEVLHLNRLETGKLELTPVPGDLVQTLRRIVEADAPLAERNGINLTFECDVESCPRLHDQEKLEKIVGNLLSNALKFTRQEGTVRVALRCRENVEILVVDDGPGIPREKQETVFERFAQVEDGSHHGGTGIGLALAKELAELHGGTITVESEPGKGSTFTVRLPLETISVDDLGTENGGVSRVHEPAPGGGETPQPDVEEHFAIRGDGTALSGQPAVTKANETDSDRTTVLVIEDNDDVRTYVRRSLEETYRVLGAANGETGLQQAREKLPDLIVSDVMLPGIDGYEVARRLKAEPATECIPVAMLTARAAEEDQTKGYGSGAEIYITKPFVPETLRAALARLLAERRRLRRRLRKDARHENEETFDDGKATLADRARGVALEHFYDEDFGAKELASALNMTRRTLYNRLKSEVDLSPSDFIRILRLEQARELLSKGAGSVSEVAYAVGFNSLSVFSRAYRTHYGTPPSAHLDREIASS